MGIDFEGLAANLLAKGPSLLQSWLPGGKLRGHEFVCGNLNGEAGESLSINVQTGVWADFASDDKGADLIDLYAAINQMTQGDAAKALLSANGFDHSRSVVVSARKPVVLDVPAERPPANAPEPGPHHKHGPHTALYAYRDAQGLIGYVARYELADGSKTFSPWRWLGGKWQAKGLPKPRPLYGLERLPQERKGTVLLVEGEKCADAARAALPQFTVLSWSGGVAGVAHADWEPLTGRKVALWPDNDEAGRGAVATLAVTLVGLGCAVKIINPEGQPDGWDVGDAIAEGWDKTAIMGWIQRDGGRFLVPFKAPAPQAPSATPDPVSVGPDAPAGSPTPEPAVLGLTLPPELRGLKGSEARQIWGKLGLDMSAPNGVPISNEDTVFRIVSRFPDIFWRDEFLKKAMTSVDGPARPMTDVDFKRVAIWIQSELSLPKIGPSVVGNAIDVYTASNVRNVALEWIEGLKWDGTPRLDKLLPLGFGTVDDEYHRKVGRNFIMQMVHRVMEPGCQADYMPVFEGGQGKFKSSALRVLGNDWFTESHEDIMGKDFLQLLPGKMLIEISELASFTKGAIEKIKGIISNRVDCYRPSYGRFAQDFPRMCVFAGTTNRDDWNQDDTGARRMWRVQTGNIDLAWIRANRDQLIAEAAVLVGAGQEHYMVPETEARRLQDGARDFDVWHSKIIDWCAGKDSVRVEDILSLCMDIPLKDQDKPTASRVRAILRVEGWVSQAQRFGGKVLRAWRPPSIADAPQLPGMQMDERDQF